MLTPDYTSLEENELDAVDAALYSSDMFYVKENRDHLKSILTGWLKKINQIEFDCNLND